MKSELTSLSTVTLAEAHTYMAAAREDELGAALLLAEDRIALARGTGAPDEVEVHQALFLLRRALGLAAPSFDWMRVELRHKLAA